MSPLGPVLAALLCAGSLRAATLDSIAVEESNVVFSLSAAAPYEAHYEPKGRRLTIEFKETADKAAAVTQGSGDFVSKVAASGRGNSTVAVVELSRDAVYDVSWQGPRMTLWLGDVGADGKRISAAQPAVRVAAPAALPPAAPAPRTARVSVKPAAASAKAGPARRYFVLAGSFMDEAKAVDLKDTIELEPTLSPVSVAEKKLKGKTYFQVRIGPVDGRKAGRSCVRKLAAIGQKAYLVLAP